MSALSAHQLLTRLQILNSREGFLRKKRGRFLMQQNARLSVAKRKVKCRKTRGEMLLNAPKNATKRKAECINLHVLSCC